MKEIKNKKVILHDIQYSIGGPKTVLNSIQNSYLGNKFKFIRLKQTESCGFNVIKAIIFINKYCRLINREKADVIYICGLQYSGFLMTVAAKLSNVKKIVLSVHGSDWDNPDGTLRKKILMHIIEPLEVRLSDTVFTVCGAAQRTIGSLRYAKHNDGIVYNTFPNVRYDDIDFGKVRKELEIPSNKIIVSVVGRVVEAKGHKFIIDALTKLNDKEFVFLIVGDGPFLECYKDSCAELINERRLYLLGVRNDVNFILKDSDIFLFATLNENHSVALLEAVNMHCAVICTNVGGNPEIIQNGDTGILISPNNSDDIIKALIKMKDCNLRKKYSLKAYSICSDKFSIEKTYGKLERIFNG